MSIDTYVKALEHLQYFLKNKKKKKKKQKKKKNNCDLDLRPTMLLFVALSVLACPVNVGLQTNFEVVLSRQYNFYGL